MLLNANSRHRFNNPNAFQKVRGGTGDAKKLTRGVMRTTMAAFIISSGRFIFQIHKPLYQLNGLVRSETTTLDCRRGAELDLDEGEWI